ncbi:MAG: DUF4388 domain-containing protein, partial [Chloroflexi bacterium]|nr:DUF4388 domain-containing protein [Chloroflexota bacterium]
LLNLVNLARKTGCLTISGSDGAANLFFNEGKLVQSSLDSRPEGLGETLLRSGKLTEEQYRALSGQPGANTDKGLGLLAVNRRYITQEEIMRQVRGNILEIIYLLFTWEDGSFRFEPTIAPPDGAITVSMSLEGIIMEGSRRIQEWERLQDEIPDLDAFVRFTDHPDAKMRNINLTVEEWKVISFINPRNNIRRIAKYNAMNEFQIRKIIYGLLSAGLVEIITPQPSMVAVSPRQSTTEQTRTDSRQVTAQPPKRGLILRLIDRVRGL